MSNLEELKYMLTTALESEDWDAIIESISFLDDILSIDTDASEQLYYDDDVDDTE